MNSPVGAKNRAIQLVLYEMQKKSNPTYEKQIQIFDFNFIKRACRLSKTGAVYRLKMRIMGFSVFDFNFIKRACRLSKTGAVYRLKMRIMGFSVRHYL